MIQHEEEEENIGHSHERALPTGCITMLGWRQLSPTPDHAAVNVAQGNVYNNGTWVSCSVSVPNHSADSHKDCFLLSLTT